MSGSGAKETRIAEIGMTHCFLSASTTHCFLSASTTHYFPAQSTMRHGPLSLVLALMLWFEATPASAQEWRYWGGDSGGTKYSTLQEIDKSNVSKLKVAWVYDTGDFSDGTSPETPSRSAFESTPLLVDGVMYLTSPFAKLIALDPESGRELWVFDPKMSKSERINLYINRGVSYWTDGERRRLLLGDQQGRLFSIDAATGRPDPSFGGDGMIDLSKGMISETRPGRYGLNSPVAVCGDVIVAGSWVTDGLAHGPSGDIRGFDAYSGEQRWRFHVVPGPGEFGHDTWEGDSWKDRGGANSWSISSVDEENGLVFVPLTSPSTDFYGGDRHGANLFSNSLVALDCKTGERRWHYQTIHHDLWDWDLPAQPMLITVQREGKDVQAVAQLTKTGFVFLFDRLTGEPLFEIEERPIPAGDIPGEQYSPTQPHPLKPPPFARQSMTRDEITDVTPESRKECLEALQDAVIEGPLFRPIGEKFTVMFPDTNGGPNWGGGSYDPTTATLYVNSMDVGALKRMVERPEGSETPYRPRSGPHGRFWDSNQYPCVKPPWGSLTAIDMNKGEHRWRVTLGEIDELTAKGVPPTGAPNLGGSIVTAGGLVFIAATNDGRFRAFDKDTGKTLWETRLPASGHAVPITYTGPNDGKQYVAIAAGGGNKYNKKYMSKLVVFSLR